MKKTICIFLCAAAVLCSAVIVPDNLRNKSFSLKTTALNSTVESVLLDTTGKSNWLVKDFGSGGTNDWTETNGAVRVREADYSTQILKQNNSEITDVSDFKWQFEYKATSDNWARCAFFCHVDTDDKTTPSLYDNVGGTGSTTITSQKNMFGVVAVGKNSSASGVYLPYNCYKPYGLTLFFPQSNGMRPVGNVSMTADELKELYPEYTGGKCSNMPTDAGFISLRETASAKAINMKQWMTVSIEFTGRVFTVSVWQTGDKEATFRTLSYEAPSANYKFADSGDFVIANGDCSSELKNMVIKAGVPIAGEDNLVFDSVNDDLQYAASPTTVSDSDLWLKSNNKTVTYSTKEKAICVGSNAVSKGLLNYYSVNDFIWEFEYKPELATEMNTSFVFRSKNKNSLPSGDINNPRSSVKDAFAVTLLGYDTKLDTTADSYSGIMRLDVAENSSTKEAYQSASCEWVTLPDGKTRQRKPAEKSYCRFESDIKSKFYTVRIIMRNNKILASMWDSEDSKQSIIAQVCYELDLKQSEIAKSGNFAVLQGNSQSKGYIKNMRIYSFPDCEEKAMNINKDENGVNICDLVSLKKKVAYGESVDSLIMKPSLTEQTLLLDGSDLVSLRKYLLRFDTSGEEPEEREIQKTHIGLADIRDYGAVPDDGKDDTAAFLNTLNKNIPVYVPEGVYEISESIIINASSLVGAGVDNTVIIANIENKKEPIIWAGDRSHIRDLTIKYADNRVSGNEAQGERIGIATSAKGSRRLCRGAGVENIKIENVGTGVYSPASSDLSNYLNSEYGTSYSGSWSGDATIFSAAFSSISVVDFSFSGFYIVSSGRTGNIYRNIYLSSGKYEAKNGFWFSDETETEITELTVANSRMKNPVYFAETYGALISNIRFLNTKLTDNNSSYVSVDRSFLNIGGLIFENCALSSTGQSYLKFGSNAYRNKSNYATVGYSRIANLSIIDPDGIVPTGSDLYIVTRGSEHLNKYTVEICNLYIKATDSIKSQLKTAKAGNDLVVTVK